MSGYSAHIRGRNIYCPLQSAVGNPLVPTHKGAIQIYDAPFFSTVDMFGISYWLAIFF